MKDKKYKNIKDSYCNFSIDCDTITYNKVLELCREYRIPTYRRSIIILREELKKVLWGM